MQYPITKTFVRYFFVLIFFFILAYYIVDWTLVDLNKFGDSPSNNTYLDNVTLLEIDFKYMGQNTFLCFVLDNPNMIVEHWGMKKIIKFTCLFEIAFFSTFFLRFEWKTVLDWATFIQLAKKAGLALLVNISQHSEAGSK